MSQTDSTLRARLQAAEQLIAAQAEELSTVHASYEEAAGRQQALEQQEATAGGASPLVCVSALQAGSYARYTYRGPYYGLDRAWDDFDAAISSTASTFEAVEGAPFFQIFANYGENTLAADLRTDLYVRCKGV